MKRWSRVLIILLLISGSSGVAAEESELSRRGVDFARAYLSPNAYTYRPNRVATERAASTVAVTGHLLLEAYLVSRDERFLNAARIAADSVSAHGDQNGDGKIGWGRFWGTNSASPSMPGDGSNTTFAMGCELRRNRPYDDEMYDNGRIGHFLLDMHKVTGNQTYLDSTRRMLDDTMDQGSATPDGIGFYYFKTIGPCDRGWHVKNINMLMAVPVALMAERTGDQRYWRRLRAMMHVELAEIRRSAQGRPIPNLGYYAIHTMREKPQQGTYVARAQSTDPELAVTCNPKTASGESCTEHIGLEARAIDVIRRSLPNARDIGTASDLLTLMAGHELRDTELCSGPKMPSGRPRSQTYCAAYYCALRQLKGDYVRLCLERTAERRNFSPDLVLGIFWGRADRFPLKAPPIGTPR